MTLHTLISWEVFGTRRWHRPSHKDAERQAEAKENEPKARANVGKYKRAVGTLDHMAHVQEHVDVVVSGGHKRVDCRQGYNPCYKCGKPGHPSNDCTAKKGQQSRMRRCRRGTQHTQESEQTEEACSVENGLVLG